MSIVDDIRASKESLLYDVVNEKSQMLELPIKEREKIIGFGNFHNFYMYYITFSNDKKEWVFNARKKYIKDLDDNVIKLSFDYSNEREIIKLIDDIYSSYQELKDSYDKENKKESENDQVNNEESVANTYIEKLNIVLEKVRVKIEKDGDCTIPYKNISNRILNRFLEREIHTFKELSNYTGRNIYNWRSCGRSSIKGIIELMEDYLEGKIENYIQENTCVEETYEFADTISIRMENIVLNRSYQTNSTDELEEFVFYGQEIIRIIDEFIKLSNINYRNIEILKEYTYSDTETTLQAVGEKYGITRERVRQIVCKTKRQLTNVYKRKSMRIYQLKVQSIFDKISDDQMIDFISYGLLTNNSERKTKAILSIILRSEPLSESIVNMAIENMKGIEENVDKVDLLSMSCFPNGWFSNINLDGINCVETGQQYEYLKVAKNKLLKLKQIEKIIENPNVCYYKNIHGNHYPHFLVKLKMGQVILIVVYPVFSFAKFYNKDMFESLNLWCKQNNVGYIIMNESFKTIFEVKNTIINENLMNELNSILNRKKYIRWIDIVELRKKYKLTQEIITAYVMQNNLYFTLKPFVIKRVNN